MSKLGFSKRDNYTRCMNSAVYSLAMREHSRLEIKNKLKKKDFSVDVDIDALIDDLEEKGYLNEARFIESYIRYRSSRGQGPVKIKSELMQRGIRLPLISSALQEAEINWFNLAKEQKEKKFGAETPLEFKEKSKQMRFLLGRGFDTEVIRVTVG